MSRDIIVNLIDPDPSQPRQYFDKVRLGELAASIDTNGLAVPILLRPAGDRFIIVHGERRWRAVKSLGWESIPAEVRDLTAEDAFVLAVIENVQRDDLSPLEEAKAFVRLREIKPLSQADVGELVGKSQQFIANRLSLLKLPDEVKELVTTREVTPSVAARLADIHDARIQKRLANQAAKGNLTVRDLEREKRTWKTLLETVQKRIDSFAELTELVPELTQYSQAVEKGEIFLFDTEIKTVGGQAQPRPILQIQDVSKSQLFAWPKYSGFRILYSQKSNESPLSYSERIFEENPPFTEEEWQEWEAFDERATMESFQFPGCEWFKWPRRRKEVEICPRTRRTYDPNYGRFIVRDPTGEHIDRPLFVRQSWGDWQLVEFNDGQGKRTRRRYFLQDGSTSTLIAQAMETVDPFAFSHHNFGRMNLWRVQKTQMSWFYIRRKTISREDAIEAIEKDLDELRNAKELTKEEFEERVLDFLQHYIVSDPNGFREGWQTVPRLSDGTVDAKEIERVYG